MRAFRTTFAVLLIAVATSFPSPTRATSFTTDQTDAWSIPGESGTGFLTFQRGSVMFGAVFVHDPTQAPIWYSATLFYAGNFIWTGDLYLTNGPWFGIEPFNQSAVTYRKVGTMTWTATSVTSGQLKYDVDGVFVVENATRQFVVNDDFSGHYAGGLHQTFTGCINPTYNGTSELVGILNISQNGTTLGMTASFTSGGSCSYTGTLSQAGQMGAVAGTFTCSDGETGSFQAFEVQVNPTGITGRFSSSNNTLAGCNASGWFGGMRVTTF